MYDDFKVLKAEHVPEEKLASLTYPKAVFIKWNGIRGVWIRGRGLLSKSLKPIRNHHTSETLDEYYSGFEGVDMVDGELISGTTLQDCTSAFNSFWGEPKFFHGIFDIFGKGVGPDNSFEIREQILLDTFITSGSPDFIQPTPGRIVRSLDELLAFKEKAFLGGHEGIIIRDPASRYKFGRSTVREQICLKIKAFEDEEAVVIGYEPVYTNTNEALKDEEGYTKRSSAKAGLVPIERLGALIVENKRGVFSIGGGPGMTFDLRDALWAIREQLPGKIVCYKFFPSGTKDLPQSPQFLGFRDPNDL